MIGSHLVYETIYSSAKATRTVATTATTTTAAAELMRHVWHWMALGPMPLAG